MTINDPESVLTVKQREVIGHLIQGFTSKEIASKIGVSPSAIDQRISEALRRTSCSSRKELVRRYAADYQRSASEAPQVGPGPDKVKSSVTDQTPPPNDGERRLVPEASAARRWAIFGQSRVRIDCDLIMVLIVLCVVWLLKMVLPG
jgi:DNA-binding CsgD family transcriptional regulator